MFKHHLIITGTGRSGTTFLTKLLTVLGLPTGFDPNDLDAVVVASARAGMEVNPFSPEAPYVIKNPAFCDILDEWLDATDTIVDHALIPVRDLFAAAESRRHLTRTTTPHPEFGVVIGGLWGTNEPQLQEAVLALKLHRLIHTVTKREIPFTLLDFPRLTRDADYLFRRLAPVLPGVTFDRFLKAFQQVSQPELVHDFHPAEAQRHATAKRTFGVRSLKRLLKRDTGPSPATADDRSDRR